jgi:outer membrane protein
MKRSARGVLSILLCVFVGTAGAPTGRAQESPPAPAAPPAPATQPAPPGAPSLLEYHAEAVTLSRDDILKSALEKNLDIAVQRYNPKIQETRITTQKAFFDPLLTGSATADESNQPRFNPLTGGFTAITTSKDRIARVSYVDPFEIGSTLQFNFYAQKNEVAFNDPSIPDQTNYVTNASATYTQSLLRNFGRDVNRTGIVIAQNTQKMSHAQFRQTVMNTLALAEDAYWDLMFTNMDQKAKEASLKLAQDFLEQTRVKVRVGTLPPIEITQAEAQVADQEEGLIIGLSAIRAAEDNLRRLMNIPAGSPMWHTPIALAGEPEVLEKMVIEEEAVKTALEKRPDLEQARLDLANKEANLHYQKNQHLYRLDLVANYQLSGLDSDTNPTLSGSFDTLKTTDQNAWSAELQLGIPLGNRAADAAYTSAMYEDEQSKLGIQQLEQNAMVEVRNAVRLIETDLKRVKAARVNNKLQEEKLAAEQKKYENGMSTAFQILTFQTDLTTSRRRENLAIVDYNKALIELDRVLGILLDTRNVSIAD